MTANPWDARCPVPGLGAASAPPLPARPGISSTRPGISSDRPGISSHTQSQQSMFPPSTQAHSTAAPPLPPRPDQSPYTAQRMPHSPGMMNNMMSRSYGYGSNFNQGSMYGYGRMPSYGYGAGAEGPQNRFIQLAEESSMPAFQSIESIVHAFGSVSMMLESTFHAVHSSFQAVLGVAEHFTKMKLQVSQVFSAVAAFRFIKYLYAKFLYLFGLATNNPRFGESVWQSVNSGPGSGGVLSEQDIKQPVRWPIIMYMGLVFAAPYIIWKLLGSLMPEEADPSKGHPWTKGVGEHFLAKVLYQFSTDREGELTVQEGQTIRLAPKHLQPRVRGWLLGCSDGAVGLVPANYIQILGRTEGLAQPPPDIVPVQPAVQDIEESWGV
eukprot:GFUD01009165.1.p1 GENE.GFUD01009165.1~~GFUD01009165.1.p1  ORF type:complete len:381 (+),score=94.95 GFUD01009165.1:51-1193(+)